MEDIPLHKAGKDRLDHIFNEIWLAFLKYIRTIFVEISLFNTIMQSYNRVLTPNYKNYQLIYWYLSNIITIVINNHSPSLTTIHPHIFPSVTLLFDDICYQLIFVEFKLRRRKRMGRRRRDKKTRFCLSCTNKKNWCNIAPL